MAVAFGIVIILMLPLHDVVNTALPGRNATISDIINAVLSKIDITVLVLRNIYITVTVLLEIDITVLALRNMCITVTVLLDIDNIVTIMSETGIAIR